VLPLSGCRDQDHSDQADPAVLLSLARRDVTRASLGLTGARTDRIAVGYGLNDWLGDG
jgi:hypothetical protein